MRKKILTGLCALAPSLTAPGSGQEPPPLVVFISVDQMRADYLDRFDDLFEGGLLRLMDQGAYFTNTYHAHAITETAPGHATLVTGVHPSRHGIVSNEWWDRNNLERVYAAEDVDVGVVGVPELPGRSPGHLLRNTLGDWLKEKSSDSKVFSVAIKDRVAVLLGGHEPDGAYWYDYDVGRFVTSTFYTDRYPSWLDEFNADIRTREYVDRTWERLLPEEKYAISSADSVPYENEGVDVAFPHVVDVTDTTISPFQELAHTPFGDEMTLDMVKHLIEEEKLGRDDVPDLLFVGASASDLIGHRFGPFSHEMQDYYIRLDRMLGDFFDFLDDEVGAESYVVVLTSDHGTAAIPEYRQSMGLSGVRVQTDSFREELIGGLTEGLHEMQIFAQPAPLLLHPLGLVLRFQGEEVTEEQLEGARNIVAARLAESGVFADVVTYSDLLANERNSEYWEQYLMSFHPDRAADVFIRYREYDVFPASITTNHGSPYSYDQHVPLIVLGAGVAARRFDRRVWTVDIAPTVAELLGVQPPGDLDGASIPELTVTGSR